MWNQFTCQLPSWPFGKTHASVLFAEDAQMSLREVMLADLECGLAIVRDGYEVVPAWRILTPENDFLILTPFDPDKPEKRQRMLGLMPRFMAWKLATGFVLTAETPLGLDAGG